MTRRVDALGAAGGPLAGSFEPAADEHSAMHRCDLSMHDRRSHAAGRWLLIGWLVVLGGVFGSFMNVVVYRLPRRMSLSRPGSHCPACGHAIRWHDNVPVVGLVAAGRPLPRLRRRDLGPLSAGRSRWWPSSSATAGLDGDRRCVVDAPESGDAVRARTWVRLRFICCCCARCSARR